MITNKAVDADLRCVDEQYLAILWDNNMNINSLLAGTVVEYSCGVSSSNLGKKIRTICIILWNNSE